MLQWPALAYPDPEYRQKVKAHWQSFGRNGSTCEYQVVCKDGKRKDIEFRAVYLPNSRIILTLWDVTDRKTKEKELQESRANEVRLKKMESLGLLAGGVAHDLNNIFSGLVSYPELILLELPEGHKLRRPIELMRESGLRATAIVQDLLTVARGVAMEKESININSIVKDYLRSPDYHMVQKYHPGVKIECTLDENLANIIGSRIHIRKILMNLVSNGFEAIETTGVVRIATANIQISTRVQGDNEIEEGEYVVLTVADQGTGISSEDLDKIFEPFYSKKVMGRSGTGLGLTVVWNVVQDHHGYIKVESSSERTLFTIYFPSTQELECQPVIFVDLSTLTGHGELVLVVDDVASQRVITSSIIEKLGYRVESVPSGEEAVEFVKRQPVDLLILDMIMSPGISGRETYSRIIRMYPEQKAIIVSGYAETEDVKETLRLGAGAFLKKPLMIGDLANTAHSLLSVDSCSS
jgi:signal transduction histidine kinase/CheY-like chemotaxis protein